ncbi:MAG: P1 family peptidase [Inquilinus limosus]|uniref:P1 family peptidase n=1 Tax=Inquilinus limosus TaxID=171674 RepID=A0A952KDA6_9PROT|nr:P1 family peptidase [Inquilinus limosus]
MTQKPRARDLGIPFDGEPGPLNAITDVAGIEVGFATIVTGDGRLEVGRGPARTGVTAILPRGRVFDPVFAGTAVLNGNGEMTGTIWIEESGFLEGPLMITNSHSVGTVRDAVVGWQGRNGLVAPLAHDIYWCLPVVAETYDGTLNDINGFHVTAEHAVEALDDARPGPVAEGNVGGGTGMSLFGFKGGTGTASRQLSPEEGGHTVGVLVQGNFGRRKNLMIAGVPVGREIPDLLPDLATDRDTGSIIVVIATDAALLPHQLKRLARRAPVGIARTGGYGANGSGDIFLAFSTANPGAFSRKDSRLVQVLPNDAMDGLIEAAAQATEEAIVNALVAAETMTGRDGNTLHAIPHERLREILRKYNRLAE